MDEVGATHELVARARAGDDDAYERLFARVAARLLAYIDRRLGGQLRARLDPRDVLQEVYLAAHRDFADFDLRDDAGAFRRWLQGIAEHRLRNLADHHGARKRRAPGGVAPGSALTAVSAGGARPSTVCARREDLDRLVAALDDLEEEEREAVRLRHLEGLEVNAVAGAMGRSRATVLRLLGRSRLKLARLLATPDGS